MDDSYGKEKLCVQAATITSPPNYTNASTSVPSVRVTTAANTTSSRIWSLWSTANYPAECNAYYTSAGANPYALPKWNATQNVAFFSSAYNCLSSLEAYETASMAWEDGHVSERVTTWSSVFQPRVLTDTYTITSYRLTTLCDGYLRVVTGLNASSSVGISKTSYTQFSTDEVITYSSTILGRTPPYTKPPPTCRLDCAACSMLTDAMEYNLDDPLNAYGCPLISPPDSYDCNVFVASAQMFYWPVCVQNGGLCNRTGTTIAATPTGVGPNTWVYNENITLTSPSVYITFHGLQYATWILNETQSYSTSTLMAFQIMIARCVSKLDSRWIGTNCEYGVEGNGIWDPPIACQPASTAEGPSVPKPTAYTTTISALTTSPAAPCITPVSGPTQTSVAASIQISETALPESQSSTGSAERLKRQVQAQHSTALPRRSLQLPLRSTLLPH
ncbi:hypothetical protein LTR27_007585 [Elasticomyces elasticus]|nr:hypothetical protein LTR27_007585 [Elasticomyces elasticus]